MLKLFVNEVINSEYFPAISKKRRAECSPLPTGILYGYLQRVTIPDAVIIQFVLLKMSVLLFEICRGL